METTLDSLHIRRPKLNSGFRTTTLLMGLSIMTFGCATYTPVPKGYSGGTARLMDSVGSNPGRCASFFFLEEYDGHDVPNTLTATQQRNSGHGFAMTVESFSRTVPAQEATFHLKGRTHCAAPIIEVGTTVYMIEGDVKFIPEPDGQYVVKGELRPEYSALWVEELSTGKQRGNKLLVNGSTALNRGSLLLLGEGAAKPSKQNLQEIPPQ